jgi:hypothetical protein
MPSCNCPKCDADISESYEPDDWSVGINAGWFCDACDLAVGDDGQREPMEGDVYIAPAPPRDPAKPLGTPLSELSGQPGQPGFAEFCRIARSYGYD